MSKLYDLLSAVIAKIAKVADEIPAVDTTLTVKGAAADAAAVGDALDEKAPKELRVMLTFNASNPISSHSPSEILEHYNGGGTIHCTADSPGRKLELVSVDENTAVFETTFYNNPFADYWYIEYYRFVISPNKTITRTIRLDGVAVRNVVEKHNNVSGVTGKAVYNYAIPTPSTASVGQIFVVKAVDDSGKPTECEAVDLPKSAAVADAAGDTPTAEEFNALLAALRSAGLMAAE